MTAHELTLFHLYLSLPRNSVEAAEVLDELITVSDREES